VVVLCGAGGVGKTTISAALALAAADRGRRALVLTIDPARRLAQALGLPEGASRPIPVSRERLAAAGLTGSGTLDAWMLDPRVVFESLIRRLAPPDTAREILATRLYHHLTDLVAGMQEYTAAEALFEFAQRDQYDLVVLDTPPSRNALEFLEAPGRLARFLDDSIVQLFLPREGGLLQRAGRLLSGVFSRVFGEQFIEELQLFLGAFSGLFVALKGHTAGVRALLGSERSSFLLVTSAQPAALDEALFFRDQILSRALPFGGFLLNRSLARLADLPDVAAYFDPTLDPEAMGKLAGLAARERKEAERDAVLLWRLEELAGPERLAVAAPQLGEEVEDLAGLLELGRALVSD
jgi:anion-transporting  ArsA/GET3 family ATPase